MQEYRKILKQLEKAYAPTLLQDYGLVCRQMQYSDEDVALYVAKKHWTNRFDHKRENTIGVFFLCLGVSRAVEEAGVCLQYPLIETP